MVRVFVLERSTLTGFVDVDVLHTQKLHAQAQAVTASFEVLDLRGVDSHSASGGSAGAFAQDSIR